MNVIDSIVTQAASIAKRCAGTFTPTPSCAFEEVRTADVVAQTHRVGHSIHRGLGKTGVVGIVKGRDGGANGHAPSACAPTWTPCPCTEFNTFAHASKTPPARCTPAATTATSAMLLAAAQHFAKHRNFDGTVYLIFQPAEEGGGGARVMIEDGLFEQFPMEAVFGMHNWPGMPVGTVCRRLPGPVMASSNEFKITIRGARAATPRCRTRASTRCRWPAAWCRPSRPSSAATRSRWMRA